MATHHPQETSGSGGMPEYYVEDLGLEIFTPTKERLADIGRSSGVLDATSDQLSGVVLGDYRILRELGRGGMGFVFLANQISLNRLVALKILPVVSSLVPSRLARFEREARAAATLEHPAIVRAYARGEIQGVYYLALQYIEGQDLAAAIRSRLSAQAPEGSTEVAVDASTAEFVPDASGTLGDNSSPGSSRSSSGFKRLKPSHFHEVAKVGRQVAEALQYAHENRVVHRDIKPSNLLQDKQGQVWVADFGLALLDAGDQVTATGIGVGTLRYASPEQAQGASDVDARTDIYSLGATLYELATLKPAFQSSEPAALIKAILEQDPERPRRLVPNIPVDLESIILKSMAKAPKDRYQTALEFAADLQRFLRGESVLAKQPTVVGRSIRWVQRNRIHSLSGLLTVSLLAAVILLLAAYSIDTSQLLTSLRKSNAKLDRALTSERELRLRAENQERQMRTMYRVADVRSALQESKGGRTEDVKDRLLNHIPRAGQPDLRCFVWHWLRSACNDVLLQREVHGCKILSTARSPDHAWIATADERGTIYVWDTNNWEPEAILRYPKEGEVQDLEFSPQGNLLAACGTGGSILLFRTDDWSLARTLQGHTVTTKSLAFSPDGKTLYSGARDDFLIFWDTNSWTERKKLKAHDVVQNISLSKDGRWLVTGGDSGETKVWDTQTGKLVSTLQHRSLAILATAISPDNRLVVGGGYEEDFAIWDRAEGSLLALVTMECQAWHAKFLSPTTLVVATNTGQLRIFNLSDPSRPRLLREIRAGQGILRSFEILPTQENWVVVSEEGQLNVISGPIEDLVKRRRISAGRGIRFSPDGNRILIAHLEGGVSVYDRKGQLVKDHGVPWKKHSDASRQTTQVACGIDGSVVAGLLAENSVIIEKHLPNGSVQLARLTPERPPKSLFLSPTGEKALIIDVQQNATLWDVASSEIAADFTVRELIKAVAIQDNAIALATDTGEVWIEWLDKRRRQVLRTGETTGLYAIRFSRDGKLVAAGGFEGKAYLWDFSGPDPLANFPQGSSITSLAFSHDGEYLAVCSAELQLWHIESRQKMDRFGENLILGKSYEGVAFSANDDCMAGIADVVPGGVLSIWDASRSRTTRE